MKKVNLVIKPIAISFVVVALLLVGCESVTNTETTLVQPEIATIESNFVQGPPATSGPRVMRFEGYFIRLIVDPQNGYGYIVGANMIDFVRDKVV
ncbi:MAG: hypothetical protein R3220_13215 [Balneolaceae bacterium]|nr:hypothetical protein [Balneolaceae bacterium]